MAKNNLSPKIQFMQDGTAWMATFRLLHFLTFKSCPLPLEEVDSGSPLSHHWGAELNLESELKAKERSDYKLFHNMLSPHSCPDLEWEFIKIL